MPSTLVRLNLAFRIEGTSGEEDLPSSSHRSIVSFSKSGLGDLIRTCSARSNEGDLILTCSYFPSCFVLEFSPKSSRVFNMLGNLLCSARSSVLFLRIGLIFSSLLSWMVRLEDLVRMILESKASGLTFSSLSKTEDAGSGWCLLGSQKLFS